MNVYMIENVTTGKFYRRNYRCAPWVAQNKASIWSSRVGLLQALNRAGMNAVIRTFTLESVNE